VAAKSNAIPTKDVVSAVGKDDTAAGLLPSGVTGLTVAVTVGGTPPGTGPPWTAASTTSAPPTSV
jgi:polar amino acid transport system substrate-binding protein